MKYLLLAAAALIAAPALAQTTPAGDPAMPTQQTTPPTDPAAQPTPPAGDPATAPAPAQGAAMPAAPADGASPAGGYQPTGNGMSGPMQSGAPVTFKQAPTPAEAYPAPAPMAKYPICKKGQYDHCMQRGGR